MPQFSLPDQSGNLFYINTVLGKNKLVIFFYPQDGSLSCTREPCYFWDLNDVFVENEAVVIGIIGQSVESHKEFTEATVLISLF